MKCWATSTGIRGDPGYTLHHRCVLDEGHEGEHVCRCTYAWGSEEG